QVPYQPFTTILTTDNNANAETTQMQVEVTRRYSGGLSLQASYTWAKTIDNAVATPQNPYDAALDRGNGNGIRHHVFYASSTYELPFGPGKPILQKAGRLSGGWSLSGILQLRSGLPFSMAFSPTLAGWYANRPDVVGA